MDIKYAAFTARTVTARLFPQPEIEWVEGDLSDSRTLAICDAGSRTRSSISPPSVSVTQTSILQAAKEAGIRRAIFISTTAIFTRLNAKSKDIRLAAEHAIQDSGLEYTILRPTMIYGSPR